MSTVDLIILFASGLAMVMALGLLVRPLYFRNVVLAGILALLGFLTFLLYLLHSQKVYEFPILFFFQIPVVLTLGPLLYFYALSLTGDKDQFTKKDILHLFPLLVVTLYMIQYFLYSPNIQRKIVYELINQNKQIALRAILTASSFSPIVYILTPIIRIILKIRKNNPVEKTIVMLLLFLIIWLITGIVGIGVTIALDYPVLKYLNLFVSLVILFFYLLGQRYPYFLQYGTVHVRNGSYSSKSYLNGLDLDDLGKQLNLMMVKDKLFSDEDLTLPRLSSALGVTPHQLSQYLNQHHNKNFNNFVNGYRIEEAKKLLISEPERNTLSIALSVGFNSYSAFHSAFRKETKLSPAAYRKKNVK